MFKEAESRPDKIESTSNNVQARKKQQHRRRACDLLASLKRFYWPNTFLLAKLVLTISRKSTETTHTTALNILDSNKTS